MEITGISPTSAVDKATAAWVELIESGPDANVQGAASLAPADEAAQVDATVSRAAVGEAADTNTANASVANETLTRHVQQAEPLVRGGFTERVLGEAPTVSTAPPPQPPGVRADRNVEITTLQTHLRPIQPPPPEVQRAPHAALPTAAFARSEFAVPAALLVPATLVGLQVDPAAAWPLTRRAEPQGTPVAEEPEAAPPPPVAAIEDEYDEEPADDETGDEAPEAQEHQSCNVVFEDDGDGAWCEALTQVLRDALASKVPPRALLLAAEQWQRGRCVVLACPQGFDVAGPAWAFVLWPRAHAPRRGAAPAPLALHGVRVEARLQWSALPRGPKWFHVRVIKEHHPQRGRQLIPNVPQDKTGPVECEVQLGPVLARTLRCCDVCLRIHAAQRFWAALGQQWSMHVAVCSTPLLPLHEDLSDPTEER